MILKAQLQIRDMNPKTAMPVLYACDRCPVGRKAHWDTRMRPAFRSRILKAYVDGHEIERIETQVIVREYLCPQHRHLIAA